MPIKKEVTIGDCRLILGDCLEVMPTLGKVDAVVTSPPYDNLREYGAANNIFEWENYIRPISDAICEGGVIMWNVADATINGSESGSSMKQALAFMELGLNLHDTMIYAKSMSNFPESKRYFNAFEYMYIFSNGKPKTFNPIRDRRNKYSGHKVHGTKRGKDGVLSPKNSSTVTGEYGMRLNWWQINHEQSCSEHPATMPYSMAENHIESWTNTQDLVLDPFMGSGTTLVACAKVGRKGIGIELDEDYFNISVERVTKAYEQPDMLVERPKDKPIQDKFI